MCSENRTNAKAVLVALVAMVAVVLAVAGTATAAANVSVSKTMGLEAGDWILVQATGFQPNGNITIAIDGVSVFQGRADQNGALTQSVQVPYTAAAGYTKLTVTDNNNTVDISVQVKGAMESFVDTMQSLTPLTKILVGIFIILLPILLFLWLWSWMSR